MEANHRKSVRFTAQQKKDARMTTTQLGRGYFQDRLLGEAVQ